MVAEELIAACSAALPDGAGAVREVISRVVSTPGAGFGDEPFTEIYRSPELVIQQILWPPGHRVDAHDHGNLWAVVGVFGGVEENTWYRRTDDNRVERTRAIEFAAGEAVAMGPDTVHAVRNPRTHEWTAALHVYGGDLKAVPRFQWTEPDMTCLPLDSERLYANLVAAVEAARSGASQ